ncbi:MAG: non-ribosomal peptide synthetase [Candidatus Sulfotelmatobacter sp.]
MYSSKTLNSQTKLPNFEALGTPCVAELVKQRAAENPSAIALSAGSESLSYGDLDRRANRLANYLRSLGVGRDEAVGLYLDRSTAMVVTALAILKAGGAYIPLDPVQPAERLAFMLRDSGARVLVSSKNLAGKLSPGSWHVVTVDGDAQKITVQPDSQPEGTAEAEDLAYIIYTSGSTGQPKGVELLHSGLSNLVRWHQRAFQVTAADRASAMASLGFDASVWELWPYLAAGASIHLPEERLRSDAKLLRDWMVAQRITIAFAATPIAENLMELEWPQSTSLRVLLTGADTLKKYPSSRLPFVLVNNYGPTEGTVVTTSGVIAPAISASQPPSIGRAIDGVEIYLLDEDQKPVADGTAGEIYIGGAGLARGYRNRPDLTATRFISNPFRNEAGTRLYRTGDLARRLPDGEIAFLGRIDEQVKIRGYRVEPSEIATVLGQHASVQTCVVIAREDVPGEKQLVAYLVPASGAAWNAAELRDHLRKRLPDYMVPAGFVAIENLPVTANGKVDRAALPAPNGQQLHALEYTDPRTPVEEELVKILAPLLKLQRVGVNDNFFLLGGHSLLGTQLIARVSETFGVDLTLLKLFDHPTVAEMASEIEDLILAKVENEELSGDRNRSVV